MKIQILHKMIKNKAHNNSNNNFKEKLEIWYLHQKINQELVEWMKMLRNQTLKNEKMS